MVSKTFINGYLQLHCLWSCPSTFSAGCKPNLVSQRPLSSTQSCPHPLATEKESEKCKEECWFCALVIVSNIFISLSVFVFVFSFLFVTSSPCWFLVVFLNLFLVLIAVCIPLKIYSRCFQLPARHYLVNFSR